MSIKVKDRIIFLLLGIMTGVVLSCAGGVFLYTSYKGSKKTTQPKRYEAKDGQQGSQHTKDVREVGISSDRLIDGYDFYIASSLDRIFKDGRTLLKPNFSDKISLALARHEYESFQIVVSAGRQSLQSVQFEVTDLVHEKTSKVITKDNLRWRMVGYVPTKKPYYPVKYVGPWPDPLIPVVESNVAAGETQPFWFTVYASKDTDPGIYHGTIMMKIIGEKQQNIPITVKVYDFTLPRESSLTTAFDFYGHITKTRYKQRDNEPAEAYEARLEELNHQFHITMLRYRMNPILNVDPTNDFDLAKVDRYRWFGLNNFSIGKKGGTFNNNWPSTDAGIEKLFDEYRTFGEILALNKMLDYQYIYTWDEGKIGNPRVAKIASMIKRAYPKLRNMVCYHGFWDPEKHPDWGNDIDIWCFQISKFREHKAQVLKDRGMDLWMYVSGPGGDGTPNLAIDFDSIDYRIIPWMSWKYNWDGFLYWCVNWWVYKDPFKTAANTKWEQNGNGLLFYPGENGPIASLRAEIFRDGMEDYEYLTLLKQKVQQLKGNKQLAANHAQLIAEATQLLTIEESLVGSIRSFTKDKAFLQQRRDNIAEVIQRIDQALKSVSKEQG